MKNFLPFIVLVMATGCATSVSLERKNSENNKLIRWTIFLNMMAVKCIAFMTGATVYFTNCKGEAIVKTDSTEVRNIIQRLRN